MFRNWTNQNAMLIDIMYIIRQKYDLELQTKILSGLGSTGQLAHSKCVCSCTWYMCVAYVNVRPVFLVRKRVALMFAHVIEWFAKLGDMRARARRRRLARPLGRSVDRATLALALEICARRC